MTLAFLEYARANALELCPSACWANRIKRVYRLISKQQVVLLEKWHEYFGD